MNQNTPTNNNCKQPAQKGNQVTKSPSIRKIENSSKATEGRENKYKTLSLWIAIFAAMISLASAGFTYWQVVIAKDTAQKQLRAYVYASPDRLYHLGGSPTQGYITVRNGGQTFAHNVSREVGINVLSKDIPDSFEKLGSLKREPGYMTFGPNGGTFDVIFREFRVLTDEEIKEIKNDDKRIYVFGKISYEDIYDVRHETTFCFMYSGIETSNILLKKGRTGYEKTQAEYCDKYNYAN
jgi:hypothetical protein